MRVVKYIMDGFLKRRSGLALEAVEQFLGKSSGEKKGVIKKERKEKGVTITSVEILDGYGEEIGKTPGRYVSIDTAELGLDTSDKLEMVRKVFSDELSKMLSYKKIKDNGTCLVVGLGNEHITPDALGPLTLNNVIVTRHLYEIGEIGEAGKKDDFREVSALSPGVMGLTGIETYDIIESVVKKVKPDFLIVVDALAARAVARVNRMIQMTDTGISPGSGVGNRRRAIDEKSLGIPVIAIGIPTVVDAVSIANDMIDLLLKHITYNVNQEKKGKDEEERLDEKIRRDFLGRVGVLSQEEKRQLLIEVLTPIGENLIVTPKTIDSEVEDLSRLISNALNVALHPNIEFSA